MSKISKEDKIEKVAAERVIKKKANKEYREDLKLLYSSVLLRLSKPKIEEGFTLQDRIDVLSTAKGGPFSKIVNYVLYKFFWLLRNSLNKVFTIQEEFNKSIKERVYSIGTQNCLENFNYAGFEQTFYANSSNEKFIKKKQSVYLKYFKPGQKVLDIGCGFGFLLDILREKGIEGIGVDLDEVSADIAKSKGLDVRIGKAPECLEDWEDNFFDGITCLHVVEHLRNKDLGKFVSIAYRKIKKGGYLIIETPNIQMLGTLSHTFYRDLTHIRPIHPDTLSFMLRTLGFTVIDTIFSSSVSEKRKLKHAKGSKVYNENIDKLNDFLFGFQDYGIVVQK